jgi:hypothetical protein
MDYSSEFIKDKALFGSYPTQENVYDFENIGVRHFIDLTSSSEKNVSPYKTQYNYIRYPIADQKVPTNWKSFSRFIVSISEIILSLKGTEKIYIHCKGGHGRSGVVVSCLLCYMYNISPEESLEKTSFCHSKRKIMKDKWRKIGSPQTRMQKNFVLKFFEPLYVYKNFISQFFSSKEEGWNQVSKPTNVSIKPSVNKIHLVVNKKVKDFEFNDELKTIMIYNILKDKSENIQNYLLTTGLRPIFVLQNDTEERHLYDNTVKKEVNPFVSKLVMNVREELYKKVLELVIEMTPKTHTLNYQHLCMVQP